MSLQFSNLFHMAWLFWKQAWVGYKIDQGIGVGGCFPKMFRKHAAKLYTILFNLVKQTTLYSSSVHRCTDSGWVSPWSSSPASTLLLDGLLSKSSSSPLPGRRAEEEMFLWWRMMYWPKLQPANSGPGWVAERNRKYIYMCLAIYSQSMTQITLEGRPSSCIESHPIHRCVSANTSPH